MSDAAAGESENLARVRGFLHAMMIERDRAKACGFLGGALLAQATGGPGALTAVLDAVSEVKHTVTRTLESGDTVVVFSAWEARHTQAPIFGVAPTGKSLHFQSADGFRLEDGKLVEHFDVVNATPLFMALGLLNLGGAPR